VPPCSEVADVVPPLSSAVSIGWQVGSLDPRALGPATARGARRPRWRTAR
jgi:hypothetical protein